MPEHLQNKKGGSGTRAVVAHPIPPVFDRESSVLILGSFPSVRSRDVGFFYGHPQNRFWRVMAGVFEDVLPETIEEKTQFLHRHHVALWDVIASCEIVGSADHSIRDVLPNDLSRILRNTQIERIYTNGKTAHALYCRYLSVQTGMEAICLPSTSPANATKRLDDLIAEWRCVAE